MAQQEAHKKTKPEKSQRLQASRQRTTQRGVEDDLRKAYAAIAVGNKLLAQSEGLGNPMERCPHTRATPQRLQRTRALRSLPTAATRIGNRKRTNAKAMRRPAAIKWKEHTTTTIGYVRHRDEDLSDARGPHTIKKNPTAGEPWGF